MNKIIKNLCLCCMVFLYFGCQEYEQFVITEKPYVNMSQVELYTGEHADGRNQVQAISSPSGVQYRWTSLDPAVATVDQTGLITAISEGFTIISVSSSNDVAEISVWVKGDWIPLERFDFLGESINELGLLDRFRINVSLYPDNTTETEDVINWISSDPSIISISGSGWITGNALGEVTITAQIASGFSISMPIEVVPPLAAMTAIPKDLWTVPGYDDNFSGETIGFSSQEAGGEGGSPNGRVIAMFDGNTNTFWHSRWSGTGAVYPHWFIVDLNQDIKLYGIMLQRRQGNNNSAEGFKVFTANTLPPPFSGNPADVGWTESGTFTFDRNTNNVQNFRFGYPYSMSRYILMYFDTRGGSGAHVCYAQFGVYGVVIP
jgi:hypothetical protein